MANYVPKLHRLRLIAQRSGYDATQGVARIREGLLLLGKAAGGGLKFGVLMSALVLAVLMTLPFHLLLWMFELYSYLRMKNGGRDRAGPTDQAISQVHIVCQRHAEAVSNVAVPESPNGIDPRVLTWEGLRDMVVELNGSARPSVRLKYGTYLPDGLTQYGLDASQSFVDDVVTGGGKLDNVYMLTSSTLTRAIQTLQVTQDACNLVGPLHRFEHQADGSFGPKAGIYCHTGIQEATPWPQDFPPLTEEKGAALYIKIAGGKGANAGTILGEEEVDLSNAIWVDGDGNDGVASEARMRAITEPPDIELVKEMTKRTRVWLRDCARKVLEIHQREGREGTPRIVVCLHGGIINFLMQKWHCQFTKDSDSMEWRWAGSAGIRNLEVFVCKFKSLTDEEAELEELDKDDYYEDVLGRYYRHMASDESLVYKNPDGTDLDQVAEHWKFIERTAREVQTVAEKQEKVVEALVNWKGARNFLEQMS